jgi:L-fucose dehydrogenase
MIITGGAKGIGASVARCFAEEGGIPVIVGRSQQAGARLAQELRELGHEAHAIYAELASWETCGEAVAEAANRYGRLDALVNNAATNDKVGLEEGSPKDFVSSCRRNLFHYYDMAHFCVAHLKKTKGAIVNISSKIALTGQGNTSGYAAAKGAQLALTREWAVELLKYEIRVNAVIPSEVMTESYRRWLDTFEEPEQKLKSIEEKIPLGNRMTTANEIASMVVFLASKRASHITGQHIYVDGGYVHLDRALSVLNT